MTSAPDPFTLAILDYPGAQAAAVHGLMDLFEVADRLKAPGARGLQARVLSPAEGLPAPGPPFTALVLPPSLREGAPCPALSAWIAERHREGTLVCSVCAGAFLLAEAGLLEGRHATTHWALKERFAARFPGVHLDTDKLLVDDGDILTAGGVMAWMDLGLRLVGRYLGSAVMLSAARFFIVDPGGREQRFYTTFAPVLDHGDTAVLKAQRWLQTRSGEKTSVPRMAAEAGLGERTFLRRFRKATGLRPADYVQHLHVAKARELLEQLDLGVDEIAWRVGYEDPAAFRKVFVRCVGLPPGEYRRRFAVGLGPG